METKDDRKRTYDYQPFPALNTTHQTMIFRVGEPHAATALSFEGIIYRDTQAKSEESVH